MSQMKNKAVRCDQCGKLSRNKLGEYTKPNGDVGYMFPMHEIIGGEDQGKDICEECTTKIEQIKSN